MNLKNKLLRALFLLLPMLWVGGILSAEAQESPFDRLINRFKEGEIFKAEFVDQYVDSYTKDTVETSGTIWVGETNYKVQNEQQTVVVDGETSRVYDQSRNRVIISKYEPEEDDFAPSRFLNGSDSTYTIASQQKKGNQIEIVLNSTDPFSMFNRVAIILNSNLIPYKISTIDQADNTSTTTFMSGSFLNKQDEVFDLDYPDSAEIIDMRN